MDPLLATLQVDVLAAHRSVLGPRWTREGTVDPFARLYYVESGSGYLRHHDREYLLARNRVYVIPAHTPLSFGCPKRVVIRWLHFTAGLLCGLDLFDYLHCRYELEPAEPARVRSLFARAEGVFAGRTPAREMELRGLLLQMIAPFAATSDSAAQARHREKILRFNAVLDHIERNIAGRLRVPELARIAHLEPTYFSRVFARHFGAPPTGYIMQKRIERAQRLLWQTEQTIDRIGAGLGFYDAFHFSKAFKRIAGVSPRDFRRRREYQRP